jgi:diketogulonate reductase-like aldo/keto reductase
MSDVPVPQLPDQAVALPGGAAMPLLGFGTWQVKGDEAVTATAAALDAGYRHLDTATVYGNEAQVGRALGESGVAREDVFVTTKCPANRGGEERKVLEESLAGLGTDHVDLWLIHWDVHDPAERLAMWRALIAARDEGLARDIGVSNYSVEMIDALESETGVRPAVNQIEWSPFLFDAALLEEHRAREIVLEGYSALRNGTLTDPTITGIPDRLGRTPAQVIIRWHLQHGTVVIPKSVRPARIRSNADVGGFDLTADDMEAIDSLGRR